MTGRLGRKRCLATLAAKPGRPIRGTCSDRGATATEYAILVGFIAVVIAVAVGLFGSNLSGYYSSIVTAVNAYL